jgi:hypothetical protein
MRIGVTIRACLVAEPVAHRAGAVSETLALMAGRAFQIGMRALERVCGEPGMIEGRNLERVSGVTGVAFPNGLAESKLTRMNIAVTVPTLSRRTGVRRTATTQAILLRWTMTAITRRL